MSHVLYQIRCLILVLVASLGLSAAEGTGNGLLATYYANETLSGSPAVSRTDAQVNFAWSGGAPASGMPVDSFSARWEGEIEARFTENLTLIARTDDGVRLWLDGQLVIDQWVLRGAADSLYTIAAQAGRKYRIRLEYYEHFGSAVAQLLWQSASIPRSAIPSAYLYPTPAIEPPAGTGTGLLARYYANETLSGTPVLARTDVRLDFGWGGGSPDGSVPVESFSARWDGEIEARVSEPLTIIARTDDGVRVWINGQVVIDAWMLRSAADSTYTFSVEAGQRYRIRMEYYEHTGAAVARLWWQSANEPKGPIPTSQLYPTDPIDPPNGTGTGLLASYFANETLSGAPVLNQTEARVDHAWGGGSPGAGVPVDVFSARWLGEIEPRTSEPLTIIARTDDGVRLWIDGQLVIDQWILRGTADSTYTFSAEAGRRYSIRMEYFEHLGSAVAKLWWQSASEPKSPIPTSQLYPTEPAVPPAGTGTGLFATYFANETLTGDPILSRVEARIDHSWGGGSPGSPVPVDVFSARWEGEIEPRVSEPLTLIARTDDGVRVWLDDVQVINAWILRGAADSTYTFTPVAGQRYRIRMEYFEHFGSAVAKLWWQSANEPRGPIPTSQLYPLTGTPTTPTIAFASAGTTVVETVGSTAVAVTLSQPATTDVTVAIQSAGSGATAPASITILAGATTGSVPVTISDDPRFGPDRQVTLSLANPVGADLGPVTSHVLTIQNTDTAPTIAFTTPTSFNLEQSGTASVVVRLSAVSAQTTTVTVGLTGTAEAGSDYQAPSATLQIPADTFEGTIFIPLLADSTPEQNETIILTLSAPVGATLSSSTVHTITLSDGNLAPVIANGPTPAFNPVTGTSVSLSFVASDDGGAANLSFTWSTVGTVPAPVSFSPATGSVGTTSTTTASFTAPGTYPIQIQVRDAYDLTATAQTTITVQSTPTLITVAPGTATVSVLGTQAFTATGVNQFGNALAQPLPVTWSVAGGGSIAANGLFTAGTTAGGPFTVTATLPSAQGVASVTVINNAPTVVQGPQAIANATETGLVLTALGSDDGGEAALTYQWSVEGTAPGIVTFAANSSNAAKSTTATLSAAGSYALRVTVTDGAGQTGSATTSAMTIPANLSALTITPASVTIGTGTTHDFAISGVDQFGTTITALPTIVWSVAGGGTIVSTANGARFTAGASVGGPHLITASVGTIQATASVTIQSTPMITQQPQHQSAVIGDVATFGVVASGAEPLSYAWQVSANSGTSWQPASGTASATTYQTSTVALNDTGHRYRVLVSNPYGQILSTEAVLTVTKRPQTITFAPLDAKTYLDAPFALGASATSGLLVVYDSSNTSVATVTGNQITIHGAGTTTITASQPGDDTFAPATPVTQNLVVSKATQTITFAPLANKQVGDAPFTLAATTSSGVPVTYTSSNTAVATVDGVTLTIVGAGSTSVTASAAGTTNFEPAQPVSQPLAVSDPTTEIPTVVVTTSQTSGTTTALSALVSGYAGNSAALTYTWAATPAAGVIFTANGTHAAQQTSAIVSQPGAYDLQMAVSDSTGVIVTGTTQFTITAVATHLAILPGNVSIPFGSTQAFQVRETDQFGSVLPHGPVTWSASGAGSITATGLFTASSAVAQTTITAQADGLQATVTASTSDLPLIADGPAATPATVTTTSTTLSVVASDPTPGTVLSYRWEALSPSIQGTTFSVNNAPQASTTVVTFPQAGSYTFRVTVSNGRGGNAIGTAVVQVAQTATSLAVMPVSVKVQPQETQQFSLSASDQFHLPCPAPANPTWSTTGGGTIAANGVFTATTVGGPFLLTAEVGGLTANAFAVVAHTPTIVTAATATPNPVTGTTTALSVNATDPSGAALTYAWTITEGAGYVYLTGASTQAPTAQFLKAGTYTFRATATNAAGMSVTSSVTVPVTATVTGLTILPTATAMAPGATQTIGLRVVDQFGAVMTNVPRTWSATNGTIDGTGVFTAGMTTGPAQITVTVDTLSANAVITIATPPTFAVAPAVSPEPVVSTTATLSVLGADPAGESQLRYTWSVVTGPYSYVNFPGNGTNSAKSLTAQFYVAGNYVLRVQLANAAGLTASSDLPVTVASTPTAVSVSPSDSTVNLGSTLSFTAYLVNQFNNTLSTSSPVTWSVSGGGTISSDGIFTSTTVGGPFTVTAQIGVWQGTTEVSVQSPSSELEIVAGPTVSPDPVTGSSAGMSVTLSGVQNPSALSVYWDGYFQSGESGYGSVYFGDNYSSSATNTTAYFSAAGTYYVTVTVMDQSSGQQASASRSVTVISTPQSVTVTPNPGMVSLGRTQQFILAGSDQFSMPIPGLTSATWTVTGGGTITSTGLFTATTVGGPFTVTATQGTLSATASVTVGAGPSVALTADPALVTGETTVLTALPSDGSSASLLSYAWSVAGTPPAAVAFEAYGSANTIRARFNKTGDYLLAVTATNAAGYSSTTTVPVTVVPTLALTVEPASVALPLNKQWQFHAVPVDQFGDLVAVPVTWSVTGAAGTITPTGVFTAGTIDQASAVVRAAIGDLYATSHVTLNNTAPVFITEPKTEVDPVTGSQATLIALARDDGGPGNLTYSWQAGAGAPGTVVFSVNGTAMSETTTASFSTAGVYPLTLTVRDGSGLAVSGTLTVTVASTVGRPVFEPRASDGPFIGQIAVTLQPALNDPVPRSATEIWYTIGQDPADPIPNTQTSIRYHEPIVVSSTATIKAVSVRTGDQGMSTGPVVTATYVIIGENSYVMLPGTGGGGAGGVGSPVSPYCMEVSGPTDGVGIRVEANGSQVDDTHVIGVERFYANAPLDPLRSTELVATITDRRGVNTTQRRTVAWSLTDLSTNPGAMTIRRGDSLLLTATGAGQRLRIEPGVGTGPRTGTPGTRLPVTYPTPGIFTAVATIDERTVGTLEVTVVDVPFALGERIPAEVNYKRSYKATTQPGGVANAIVFTSADDSVLEVTSDGVAYTEVTLGLKPLKRGMAVLLARAGGINGPIICAKEVDEFELELVGKDGIPYPRHYYDAERIPLRTAVIMRPYLPHVRLTYQNLSEDLVFPLSADTSDMSGQPVHAQDVFFDQATDEIIASFPVSLTSPSRSSVSWSVTPYEIDRESPNIYDPTLIQIGAGNPVSSPLSSVEVIIKHGGVDVEADGNNGRIDSGLSVEYLEGDISGSRLLTTTAEVDVTISLEPANNAIARNLYVFSSDVGFHPGRTRLTSSAYHFTRRFHSALTVSVGQDWDGDSNGIDRRPNRSDFEVLDTAQTWLDSGVQRTAGIRVNDHEIFTYIYYANRKKAHDSGSVDSGYSRETGSYYIQDNWTINGMPSLEQRTHLFELDGSHSVIVRLDDNGSAKVSITILPQKQADPDVDPDADPPSGYATAYIREYYPPYATPYDEVITRIGESVSYTFTRPGQYIINDSQGNRIPVEVHGAALLVNGINEDASYGSFGWTAGDINQTGYTGQWIDQLGENGNIRVTRLYRLDGSFIHNFRHPSGIPYVDGYADQSLLQLRRSHTRVQLVKEGSHYPAGTFPIGGQSTSFRAEIAPYSSYPELRHTGISVPDAASLALADFPKDGEVEFTASIGGRSIVSRLIRLSTGVGMPDSVSGSIVAFPGHGSVNLMSGNLYFTTPIVQHVSPSLRADLTLSYNSFDDFDNGIGRGWRTDYDMRVYRTIGEMALVDETGVRVYFDNGKAQKSGRMIGAKIVAKDDVRTQTGDPRIAWQGDENFVLIGHGNRLCFFDQEGWLVRIRNLRGEELNVTRDANGIAQSVQDDYGPSLALGRSMLNDTASGSDPIRRLNCGISGQWEFAYDDKGNMTSMASLSSSVDSIVFSHGEEIRHTFVYDDKNRVTRITKPMVTMALAGGGSQAQEFYQQLDYVARTITEPANVTSQWSIYSDMLATWRDPNGLKPHTLWAQFDDQRLVRSTFRSEAGTGAGKSQVRVLTYDLVGNLMGEQRLDSNGASTEPAKPISVTSYTYTTLAESATVDEGITLPLETRVGGVDGIATTGKVDLVSTIEYETAGKRRGLPRTRTDSAGTVTRFTYSDAGFLTDIIDTRGKTWSFREFTSDGQPQRITSPEGHVTTKTYRDDGQVASVTDVASNLTTQFTYDAQGRQTGQQIGQRNPTSSTFDPLGNLTSSSDEQDRTTSYDYDAIGRLVRVTQAGSDGQPSIADLVTSYERQADGGWMITTQRGEGAGAERQSQRRLDPGGRLKQEIVLRTLVGGVAGPTPCTTTYSYDQTFGFLTGITDARGFETVIEQDGWGRTIKTTSPEGGITTMEYNALDQVIRSVNPDNRVERTYYTTRGEPRLSINPAGGWTEIRYDAAGNVTAQVPSLGNGTSFEYDDDGVAIARVDVFGKRHMTTINRAARTVTTGLDGQPALDVVQKFDGRMFLDKIQTTLGETNIERYDDGAVEGLTAPGRSRVGIVRDELGRTTDRQQVMPTVSDPNKLVTSSRRYDPQTGNIAESTSVTGHKTAPQVQSTGEVNQVKDNGGANPNAVTTSTGSVNSRDANGNTLITADALGRQVVQEFDRDNRLTKITTPDGGVSGTIYTLGGLAQVETSNRRASLYHQYNALGLRVKTTRGSSEVIFTAAYDELGLILEQSDGKLITSYIYHPQTRQLVAQNLPGARQIVNFYDDFGRLEKSRNAAGHETSYDYDALFRLSGITYPDLSTESFTFKPTGDRDTKTDRGGRTEQYTFDGAGRMNELAFLDTGERIHIGIDLPASGGVVSVVKEVPAGQDPTFVLGVESAADVRGRKSTFSLPGTPPVEFGYNLANQQTERGAMQQTFDPATGRPATLSHDGGADPIATEYWPNGLPRLITLPNGVSRSVEYDHAGRVKTLTQEVGTTAEAYHYGYTPQSRLLTLTGPDFTNRYGYDDAGRLADDERTGASPYRLQYSYDANGNRTGERLYKGASTQHVITFDDASSIPGTIEPSTGTWVIADGVLHASVIAPATTAEALLHLGNSSGPTVGIRVRPEWAGLTGSLIAGGGLRIDGADPAVGSSVVLLETRLADPAAFSPVPEVRLVIRSIAASDGAGTDIAVGPWTANSGTGLTVNTTLSLANRAHVVVTDATGTQVMETWQVLPMGFSNDTSESLSLIVAGPVVVDLDDLTWTTEGTVETRIYTHDVMDQLVHITRTLPGSQVDEDFVYDAVGNMRTRTVTTTDTVTNQTTTQTITNVYDRMNRLTSIQVDGGQPTTFEYYPGTWMRKSQTRGSITTWWTYDGQSMLTQTVAVGGGTGTTTSYIGGGSSPLMEVTGTDKLVYANDGRGNVTGLIGTLTYNDQPAVFGYRRKFAYDAFGSVSESFGQFDATGSQLEFVSVAQASSGPRFKGMLFDSTSNLYKTQTRSYAPDLGRFTQTDPAKAGQNWHEYCGGDPVNFHDPSGLFRIQVMRQGDKWSYKILRDPGDEGYHLGVRQERRIRNQLFPAIKRAMAGTGSTVYTQHLSLDRYRMGDPNLEDHSSGDDVSAVLDAAFPGVAAAAELPLTAYDVATNTMAAAGADVTPTSSSMTFSSGGSIDKMIGAYDATENPFYALIYASPAGSVVEAMQNAYTGDAIVFDGNQIAGTAELSTEERWQQGLFGVGGAFGMAAGVGSPMAGWSFRLPARKISFEEAQALAWKQLRASRRTTDLGMAASGQTGGRRILVIGGEGNVADNIPRLPGDTVINLNHPKYSLRTAAEIAAGSKRLGQIFVQGNANAMPFAAGTFDRVFAPGFSPNQITAALEAEILRVLTPGGRGVITTRDPTIPTKILNGR